MSQSVTGGGFPKSGLEEMLCAGNSVARTISLHRPNYFVNSDPSAILFNRHFNKGTAFTEDERLVMGLRGLLPCVVEDISRQVRRCMMQLRSFHSPLSKYNYLSALRERSDTLFYRVVLENLHECLPLIYTPTVGQACLEFGLQYRAAEGMYFSAADRGRMRSMLNNWRSNALDEVAIVVITDGSRILGLGDLGANGMGIPIGKLSLYVAAAGFHPASTLPIVLDVGTNNEKLMSDEFYLGARHRRLPDEEYYPLMEELLMSLVDKWPGCVIQFEDFSNDHCFELLARYRHRIRCFNDDIQGTGAVISAGVLSAISISGLSYDQHRFVFLGAGSAGVGVAEMICCVFEQKFGMSVEEARKLFYLVDSKGLVTANRGDKLADFKVPFARHDFPPGQCMTVLAEIIQQVKPTALIGLSSQGGAFTAEILESLTQFSPRPIVMPLSNPTSNAECTAQQAYDATNGTVIFASGSPFPPVVKKDENGEESVAFQPCQGNNMYIFPGIGLGAWLARTKEVSNEMILEAAVALSELVSDENKANGEIYPPLENIRSISAYIAARVLRKSVHQGLAAVKEHEQNLQQQLILLCQESDISTQENINIYRRKLQKSRSDELSNSHQSDEDDQNEDPLIRFIRANMYDPKYLSLNFSSNHSHQKSQHKNTHSQQQSHHSHTKPQTQHNENKAPSHVIEYNI